ATINACPGLSNSSIITVHPLPIPNFSVPPVGCKGVAVVPSNGTTGASSYLWNFGNGQTISGMSPASVYNTVGLYTIHLTAVSQYGCKDSINHSISIEVPPTAGFSTSVDSGCAPLQTSFQNLSSGYSATSVWNLGNGQTSNAGFNQSFNASFNAGNNGDTTYVVVLSVSNLCGTSIAKDTIIVKDKPHAQFVATNTGCSPVWVTYVNQSIGLNPSFHWYLGSGFDTAAYLAPSHYYVAYNTDTTYYDTLVATNMCGVDTVVHSVVVHPNTVIAVANASTYVGCAPLNVQFSGGTIGGNVWYWDFGDGGVSNLLYPSHTYLNPGIDTVKFMVNDGCSFDTVRFVIQILTPPTVSMLASTPSLCVFDTILSFTSTNNNLNYVEWNFGDGTTSNQNPTVQHVYQTPGTYQVMLAGGINNGCIDSVYTSVVIHPLPILAYNLFPHSVCLNQPGFTVTAMPSGGILTGPALSGNIFTPNSAGLGTHVLNYQFTDGNGCTNTIQDTVLVNPLPAVGIDSLPPFLCVNAAPIPLFGTPSGGTFSGPGISNNMLNPTLAAPGIKTITYTYTAPSGCYNSTSTTIQIVPLPTIIFNLQANTCINTAPFSMLALPLGGTFSGPGVTLNVFDPVQAGLGTHVITYTYTDNYGCISTYSKSITVNPLPVPIITAIPTTACLNDPGINLTATPPGGIFSGFGVNNGVFYPALAGVGGPDTIKYVVSNAAGCKGDTFTSISVLPIPTVTFGATPATMCLNDSAFILTANPPGGTFSGQGVLNNAFYPSIAGVGSSIPITYTYTAPNGCSNTAMAYISVNPLPQIAINPLPIPVCSNVGTITLSANPSGGSFFGVGVVNGTIDPANLGVGGHTIGYTYQGLNGCRDTTYLNFNVVNPTPCQMNVIPSIFCSNNNPVPLAGTPTGGVFVGSSVQGNLYVPNSAHSMITTPFVDTVTYVYTDTNYCNSYDSQLVTLYPSPHNNVVVNPLNGCNPMTVQISNTAINVSSYYWDFGDGDTVHQAVPAHLYDSVGIFPAVYIASNMYGCADTLRFTFTVNPSPHADFNMAFDSSCTHPVSLGTANNSTGALTYNWFWNGNISQNFSPTISFNLPGVYPVTLIAFNGFGCSDTAVKPFTVYPTLVPDFVPNIPFGCEPPSFVTFNNTSQYSGHYWWYVTDSLIGTNPSATVLFDTTGFFTIKLVISNANNTCFDSISKIQQVVHDPIADFEFENINTAPPHCLVVFTNKSIDAVNYIWYFGDGESSTEENPQHEYAEVGNYTVMLIAINQYGCADTITKSVLVKYEKGLFVPNTFIPYGDVAANRTFKPSGTGLEKYHIWIFDTWGTMIWESTALDNYGRPSEGWDGKLRPEDMETAPQDVYVWKIEAVFDDGSIWMGNSLKGEKPQKVGTVTLLK
ncbi:MAG: PKD domain-containing protein, partial [Chitinophagales bacterium]|nr:PKD domain-containing protein [Chitinophagales bacterium]